MLMISTLILFSNPFCPFSHAPKTRTAQETASVQHDKVALVHESV